MGGGKLFDLSTSLSEYPLDGSRWRLWQVWVVIGGEWKGIMVFETREDVLKWARMVAHENGFVVVIMRSDTYTGSRGRTSFVLIGCERSGKYKDRKKEFVRRDTGTRKCGCPFKIRGKPVHGGEGWAVKLICGIHNHELAKTLVGHPNAGRLTNDEKNIIADMTKYRLPLLDIVGVTPTEMTFSAGFAYMEGERVNNLVWALERFHIDKNVKAKCKSLVGQKNVWDYVMDNWGNLVDCPLEQEFPEHLQSNTSVRPSASSFAPPKPARMIPMLDQFPPFMHGFIEDVVDVKADDYIKIFGGTERYEQLRLSLHVDGLSKVSMDKWMDITNMRYVFLKDRCPLPPMALLWSSNAYPEAKQ
ncbi:uncharacterized protein LOC114371729 [Glycine soja]|uniref:uncharacterized protein LOC114371729 n=1 Tax=Glycine soja TaxID=3848 RepID=UPI00103FAFF6|nr:uncharacterized protein LOC114371729 [Glycine soja]